MPELQAFTVNMNNGTIHLTFSETVNVSTFMANEITLVDFRGQIVTNYSIADPGIILTNDDSRFISFQLSVDDLNAVKFDRALFATAGTSYITFSSDTVIDMSDNVVGLLSVANAIGATSYIDDMIPPNLVDYELDLNAGTVTLMFDEAVNLRDFNPAVITLLNSEFNATRSYQLVAERDTEAATNLGLTVTFDLTLDDVNELKAFEDFATEPNNTFLIVTDELIIDASRLENRNTPITLAAPLQANAVISDIISPNLVEFVMFDLDQGTLQLRFDEPVNSSSVQFNLITLLASPTTSLLNQRVLEGAGTSYVPGTLRRVIELELSDQDIFVIKLNEVFATDETNTFLQVQASAVLDQGGNIVLPSTVLPVTTFLPDRTGPIAESFSLDMDEGILIITFDDIVRVEAVAGDPIPLDISGIALQRDATGVFLDDRVQLTAQIDLGDVTNSTNGYEALVFVPFEDLNSIKADLDLATSINNTFLTLTAETVQDFDGNDVEPIIRERALAASSFIPDTTGPQLVDFDLSIDREGSLTLYFSETVNQNELVTSEITLIGDANSSFILTSIDFPRFPPTSTVVLTLGEEDLNAIKALPNLASLSSNTFLTITSQAVNDTNGNLLSSVELRAVNTFTPDSTPPQLRAFDLNLDTGVLYLSFSETVNGSSFDPTAITFQNLDSFPTNEYALTGGVWDQQFSSELQLNLTISDVNEIKRRIGLADIQDSTFLYFNGEVIRDVNSNFMSNAIVEIPTFEAVAVRSYNADATPPEFVGFSLNLTSETLELTFDETVNASSLRIDRISIQAEVVSIEFSGSGLAPSATDPPLIFFSGSGSGELPGIIEDVFMITTLTVGTENSSFTTSGDSTVLVINLGPDDLNSLKVQTGLATSLNNTFISFPNDTIADMNRNLVVPISQFEAAPVDSFFPDLTSPELVRFDLNLTRETLTLTFSEVVNASSFDVTQLTLQGAATTGPFTQSYSLTAGVINGSTSSLEDSTELVVYLGIADLNELKRLTNLATSRQNSYLVITSEAVRDMNANAVVPRVDGVNALQATVYTEDDLPPNLTAFNIDMNLGLLTLEFPETVSAASLNVAELTLQSAGSDSNQMYSLTSTSGSASADNATIVIDINREDLNQIKFLTELALDSDSTFLSLTESTITDTNSNPVRPIPSFDALQVSTYIADTTGPNLESFELNLTSEILTLHFDETVNVSSLEFMLFTIQSSLPTGINYTLTGGKVLSNNSFDVEIQLSFRDLNQLKVNTELATGIGNTFLSIETEAVFDLASLANPILQEMLPVSSFTGDFTSPQLLQFSVNLNFETLTLNFDEPVNASSLNVLGLTLLDSQDVTSAEGVILLSSGNTSSPNGLQIVIDLSTDDLNVIKRLESLLVSLESSYLAIEPLTVSDMNGNAVVRISPNDALNASSFVNDTTRPQLFAFDINLSTEIVTFEFVETVNASSIDFTGITLQQSSNTSNQYTLTGGVLLSLADSTIVEFMFFREDLNAIKAQQIALLDSTTWLTLEDFAIEDQNMQFVVPLENGRNALNVRNYIADTVRPTLDSYMLDLDSEVLILEFSETVNVFDTLSIDSFTLLSEPDANLLSDPRTHTLGLDENNTFSSDVYTPTVTIRLGRLDLNAIKEILVLATSENNTYLSIEMAAVSDMLNNPVVAISTSQPQQVSVYIEDSMAPVLEAFDLDLTLETLTLYFSEIVDPKTLDLTQFALQGALMAFDEENSRVLTGGTTSGFPTPFIVVSLNVPDLNEIKRITELATSVDDTFIRVAAAAIQDINGNYIFPIPNTNALQVSGYTFDSVRPELTAFDLNLSTERLTLTFSETVNASSVDTTGIVIQASAMSDAPNFRQLIGGTVLTADSTEVEIQLDVEDLNYIKSVPSFATTEPNTYLRVANFTVDDMNGNAVVGIINGRAVMVVSYTADDQSPVFISFNLDLNAGTIQLTFNETVNTSTLIVEQVTLQSSEELVENTTELTFTSISGTSSLSPDRPVITVDIGDPDLNEIKRLTALAISPETTFLSLSPFAIEDANMNLVVSTVLPVTIYTEDITSPEVAAFSFDLDAGQIHFTFSETINITSFDLTQITLQSVQVFTESPPTHSLTLQGGVILTPVDNTTASIELLKLDLDAIKAVLPLAMNIYSTNLVVTNETILDMNDNALVAIEADSAQMASVFIPDDTPPELESFNLDVNTGVLTLSFSETVATNTLNFEELYLQDQPLANSSFQFATSTTSTELSTVVIVFISKADLDLLKENREVGTSMNDTFIRFTNLTLFDTSGNAIVPLPDGSAQQVQSYTSDSTPPQLESFNLNINTGELTLFYTETIDINTLDPTKIVLQSSSNIFTSLQHYTLTGGFVSPVDSTVGYIQLTISDLNNIKRLIYLATCARDDTYISLIVNESLGDAMNMTLGTEFNSSVMENTTPADDNDTALLMSSGSGFGLSFVASGSRGGLMEELTFSAHVFDMAGNPVVAHPEERALRVTDCQEDTIRPVLDAYTLNLHNSTLILTFDETVNTSSLDVFEITFYNDRENSTQFYQLTASYANTVELAGQVEIEIIVSNTDLNELKRRDELATSDNDTEISITEFLILDMNGNKNIEIRPENAQAVTTYIADERDPILLAFELDLTSETLTLSFTETVNASSLAVQGITIQNENFTSYRTLEGGFYLAPELGGPILGPNDPIIVLQLDVGDLDYIKSIPDLATDIDDTYLSIERFTIADMNGNIVEEVSSFVPLQASTFIEDLVEPQLVSFDLDIDSGELFLTFSETVNVSTLDVAEITLQANALSPTADQLSFTAGNTSFDTFSESPNWPNIIVQIGIDDLNEIKRLTQLATSNESSYLTLSQFVIEDMNGNMVVPVENGNATLVDLFTPDTTQPGLVDFSVDLNQGLFQLTFDETVDYSTLNVTSITIQNEVDSDTISVELTGGSTTNVEDSTTIEVEIDIDDLNEIKRIRQLATSVNDTYISILAGTVLDMNFNPVVAVNATDALQAASFVGDTTSPMLVSFDLDMDSGTIFLTFDETVEADSLNVTEITLQDQPLPVDLNSTYTLTGGDQSTEDSTVLVVNLTFFDLNEIKKLRELASDPNGTNTFIAVTNLTVVDMNDNDVVEITEGLRVANFTEDLTPPELEMFDLDLNLGILILTFSETVDTLTFDVTQFTLLSAQNSSEAVEMFTLTEANLLTGDEYIIEQGLLYFDLNTIKSLRALATSSNDTFLSITEYAISDMNGNMVVEIPDYFSLPVTSYTVDRMRPLLESFDLDINAGNLTLTFSETVDVGTLDVSEILLLNDEFNQTEYYTLTNVSFSSSSDWPFITIQLGDDDLNAIKRLDRLAVSNDTTFIELSEFVIRDTAGNMNLRSNATRVSVFTEDTTSPELVAFDLDLTQDVVTFTFSETVRGRTLDPTQITFISGVESPQDETNDFGSSSSSGSGSTVLGGGGGLMESEFFTNYTLTGGENVPVMVDSTVLQLSLTFADRNEIKRLIDLATSDNDTFISVTSDFIDDMNTNPIVAINTSSPLQVQVFTSDETPPELTAFDLNMDSLILTLYFSETVNVSAVNVTAITLQSNATTEDSSVHFYTLTDAPAPLGSSSSSPNGVAVEINIGEEDSNAIKFLTSLAQSPESTYVSLTEFAVADMNGNMVVAVEPLNATLVDGYLPDVTGPILRDFTLNLTSERLTLTFDETIDFDSIQPDRITLQNTLAPSSSYRLVQSAPIGRNSNILVLNLTATQQDLNEIKLRSSLATDISNTFISLSTAAISDLALVSNPILPVTVNATDFFPDRVPPEVVAFSVNVNASTLTLVFDEAVNASSLDPTALRLQNSSSLSGTYFQLTGMLNIRVS